MSKFNSHKARLVEVDRKLHAAREAIAHTKAGGGSLHQLEEDIRKLEADRDLLLADMDD